MSMFFSDLIFVTFLKILLFLKQKKCPLFSIFNQLVKSYSFSFLFFSHITVAHSYLRKPCPLHLHMCLKRKTEKNVKGKKKKIFPIDYNFSHFFFPVLSSASYLRTFFGNNVFWEGFKSGKLNDLQKNERKNGDENKRKDDFVGHNRGRVSIFFSCKSKMFR
jgi:hypothetical protein